MPALQVRNLPQDIYDQLAAEAKAEHRSLAQHTTSILAEHFRVVDGGLSERPQQPSTALPTTLGSLTWEHIRTPEEREQRARKLFALMEAELEGVDVATLTPPEVIFEEMRSEHERALDQRLSLGEVLL